MYYFYRSVCSMTMSPVSFKGIYKVTLPNVKEAKTDQEKGAYTDTAIDVAVMGANSSIESPKISQDNKSVYFKIDDKNDANFEIGFNKIIDDCNKRFNIDMAKKAYFTKVDEAEYNSARAV